MLFYLLSYAVTNLGAFGVIALLDTADRPNDQVSDYAGLWNEHPVLAALMTIFLLSLGGFPPMAGFIAKWYVFTAAVKAGYTGLAIIGVLTSVISVFFYLRIVVMMYMTPTDTPAQFPAVPKIAGAALVVSAILIFYLGILPDARPRLGRRVDFNHLLTRSERLAPLARNGGRMSRMRRWSLALCLSLAVAGGSGVGAGQRVAPGSGIPLPAAQQVEDGRSARLEQWLKIVARTRLAKKIDGAGRRSRRGRTTS